MFEYLKWMQTRKRILYNKATLTGLTPEYITNMWTPNVQVHDRSHRSSVDGTLALPTSHTSVSATKYWNSHLLI